MQNRRLQVLLAVFTVGMVIHSIPGCCSNDEKRMQFEDEILALCGEAEMQLPLHPLHDVEDRLKGIGYQREEVSDRYDHLEFYREYGVSEGNCVLFNVGAIAVREERWVYADGFQGPVVEITVLEPEEWVLDVTVKAEGDRMPNVWGEGRPSTHEFAAPYKLAFDLLSSSPSCEGGRSRSVMYQSDTAWMFLAHALVSGWPANLIPDDTLYPPDIRSGPIRAMNGGIQVEDGGWWTSLDCLGSWADTKTIVATGSWPQGDEQVQGELKELEQAFNEGVEQHFQAKELSEKWPSSARDAVRQEFKIAELAPSDEHSTLLDLYQGLRDEHSCAPPVGGFYLSGRSLRILRNVPFAEQGYTFDSDDLSATFSKEPWYEANPTVNASSPPVLALADEACVARLRALENGVEDKTDTDSGSVKAVKDTAEELLAEPDFEGADPDDGDSLIRIVREEAEDDDTDRGSTARGDGSSRSTSPTRIGVVWDQFAQDNHLLPTVDEWVAHGTQIDLCVADYEPGTRLSISVLVPRGGPVEVQPGASGKENTGLVSCINRVVSSFDWPRHPRSDVVYNPLLVVSQ